MIKVVIAGGGTGGHLFPALALAQEFKERDKDNMIFLVGPKARLPEALPDNISYYSQDVMGIKGKDTLQKIEAARKAFKACWLSLRFLHRLSPDVVIGMGAYSSGPIVLAASLLRIKRVICEQNSIPGFTNRILARLSHLIFISLPETAQYLPSKKVILSGNPLRRKIIEDSKRKDLSKKGDKFQLLVLGGSQGSNQINRAMTEALPHLARIRKDIAIIHQSGEKDKDWVEECYRKSNFEVEVYSFLKDISLAYQRADLVISRAGATTISELMLYGLPSLLVPYPFSSDNHQQRNVGSLEEKGACVYIPPHTLNGKVLAEAILDLYHDQTKRRLLGEALGRLVRPDATRTIVENCYSLLARN